MSERYNGWANYETWRINLEMFDGYDVSDFLSDYDLADGDQDKAERRLALHLESMADEILDMDCPSRSGFAYDLAQSFLAKVDFAEIAEHMVHDYVSDLT